MGGIATARTRGLTLFSVMFISLTAGCGGGSSDLPATATPAATASMATATSQPTISPTEVAVPANTPVPAEATEPSDAGADVATLQALVEELVTLAEGTTEVVVELPDGEVLASYNSTEPMEAASLYKLSVMVEVYAQRESGTLAFDEELELLPGFFAEGGDVYGEESIGAFVAVDTLLHDMIVSSSNVAAAALLYRVGSENVNATMLALGIADTEIRWSPSAEWVDAGGEDADDDGSAPDEETTGDDEPVEEPAVEETLEPEETPVEETETDETPTGNHGAILLSAPGQQPNSEWRRAADPRADAALNVTTAADVAALYVMLLNGEIIGPDASQEMIDLLAQQEINDRLPAYLPGGTVVAHKTGNLDGLVHDAGVIYGLGGPIVVVVLTEDVPEDFAVDMIAQIALAAYELTVP